MSRIISKRSREESQEYRRTFEWKKTPGAGFSFPCDENGKVDIDKLPLPAQANYNKCISSPDEIRDTGIKVHSHSWVEPAILECDCGAEVVLDSFTNTCETCQRDYNMSGQLLAGREQWGEDTGESLSEILNIR